MNRKISGMLAVLSCATLALPALAHADGFFSNMTFTAGGFVRVEGALKTSDQENSNNQRGNPYDGVPELRQAFVPPNAVQNVGGGVLGLVPIVGNTLTGLGVTLPSLSAVTGNWQTPLPLTSTEARPITPANNLWNMHILRAEGEFGLGITSNLKLQGRLRLIGDLGDYSNFNAGNLSDPGIGRIQGGDPALYGGAPNYFQYRTQGDDHPLPLEWDGPNYEAYFPALFLEYQAGSIDFRLGEQQIAWGNAIFFRVFDTANGIDFRRHSLLDYAQEEYSDKRVPAPALRVSWQANQNVLFDGYVEKFQPTIYPNANTPYNIIPSQFTVHDYYSNYEDKVNWAIRMQADINSQLSVEAFVGRRYNPNGVFRWTASDVDKAFGNGTPLALVENATNNALAGGTANVMAHTPFENSPGGVYSAAEWFHYAAQVRLNGVTGLNSAITDFEPYTGEVYASPVDNAQEAYNELSTFFYTTDSLRGHIERDYFQEWNFGAGAGYTVNGTPGSLLDQLLIHLEVRYTPDRTFTDPSLGANFLHQDDWVGALVLEKYYRFSAAFPATYFVFQYMHRTRDDLFGRSLEGYGGTDAIVNAQGVVTNDPVAHGVAGGANYIVFAFQQPLPQDIYRIGFAVLADPRGSILVQPGVEWHVNNHIKFDAFYTYINARLGSNPNDTLLGGLEWANEVTFRLAYQF